MSDDKQGALYVVLVDFVVQAAHAASFSTRMIENAHASRTLEEGCVQFDVCQPDGDPTRFFLYELYRDAAAFQVHLASDHFKSFDAEVTPWVVDKRVTIMSRLAP